MVNYLLKLTNSKGFNGSKAGKVVELNMIRNFLKVSARVSARVSMTTLTSAAQCIATSVAAGSVLSGCVGPRLAGPVPTAQNIQRFGGQGQYITPAYLRPNLPPTLPAEDLCRSRLYLTLVGKHEGAIYLAGLPGRKRIVKPAILEDFDPDEASDFLPDPPLVEVVDYLPQQSIYAGSIRTVTDRFLLTDDDLTRLTLELDADGYVSEVRCG